MHLLPIKKKEPTVTIVEMTHLVQKVQILNKHKQLYINQKQQQKSEENIYQSIDKFYFQRSIDNI